MAETYERVCVGCGAVEETVHLEPCVICGRYFCPDCAVRAGFGRKFCSTDCARSYYFTGESDDDENPAADD
jgi:hypothetical protein